MAAVNTFHTNTAGARWLVGQHSADEYRVLFLFINSTEYNWMCPESANGFLSVALLAGISRETVIECFSSLCESGVMFKLPKHDMPLLNPSYFWKGGIMEHYAAERLYADMLRNPEKMEWSAHYKGYSITFSLCDENK